MHCKSPRVFQKRIYAQINKGNNFKPWLTVPNVFCKPRIGAVKWFRDSDYKKIHDSLLAKDHLIIS